MKVKKPAKRNSQALNDSQAKSNISNSSKKTRLLSPERTSVKSKNTPRSDNNKNERTPEKLSPKGEEISNRRINASMKSPRFKNQNNSMSIYTVNFKKNKLRKFNNPNNNYQSNSNHKPYNLPVEKKVIEILEENEYLNSELNEMINSENSLCSNYFRHRSQNSKSSERKFIDMNLDFDELNINEEMNDVDMCSDEDVHIKKYQDQYELWKLYQVGGFNLLFYGLGCKLSFLKNFCESLDKTDVLFIYNIQSISIKDIIIRTAKYILNDDIKYDDEFFKKTSMQEVINCISKDKSDRCLYLAINNIDRQNWRNQRDQNLLCSLGTCENIRLIATVDHINAAALWDTLQFYKFRWITIKITTYISLDILMNNSLINNIKNMENIQYISYESAFAVFSAVPFNARQTFLLMAKRQIDMALPNFNFKELKMECSKKSLANSDTTLKSHLKQFLDHKIIDLNDDETYIIRLHDDAIKKLIETK